jgi:phosphate transport system permease protein
MNAPFVSPRRTPFQHFTRAKSVLALLLCSSFVLGLLGILVWVSGYLGAKGGKCLSWSFFTTMPIASGMEGAPGGMANSVVGTLVLVAAASVVGIPLGMLTGVYLSEYATFSKLAAPVRFVADVLSGVPSIVVGVLGYELLVAPWSYWDGRLNLLGLDLRLLPNGNYNGYAGAFAMAFIMVPIVARTTEEMLRLVPQSYREASIALGASKSRTILTVVIPSATGSLVTGVMLSVARVSGETAPLLFTALGSRFLTTDLSRPFPSLTVQIFEYASGPFVDQREVAFAGILVLVSLIFLLNTTVRVLTASKHAQSH